MSVYCDWARWKVWSTTSISVWQHVKFCLNRSVPEIHLHVAGTLSNQPTNKPSLTKRTPCHHTSPARSVACSGYHLPACLTSFPVSAQFASARGDNKALEEAHMRSVPSLIIVHKVAIEEKCDSTIVLS